jgi:hypothetical protein
MTLASKVGSIQKWQVATDKSRKNDKSDDKTSLSPAEYRKKRCNEAPAWMKKAPTDGKTTKKHNNTEYTWCRIHKMWGKHNESTCRLNPANNTDNDKLSTSKTTTKNDRTKRTKSKVKYNQPNTMVAHVDVDSDDNDDSTSDI